MTSVPSSPKIDSRIPWVDTAKAIGIGLVFYGHLVQHFIGLGVPAATDQMKWIYSFHMPFFFLLVGFVYKDRGLRFEKFLKRQVLTRLVPVWVFNLVGMGIWIVSEYLAGPSGWIERLGWASLVRHCADEMFSVLVYGRPVWNTLTWFLTCLFTVEICQFVLHRLLRRSVYLTVSILCFGTLAVLMDYYAEAIHNVLGDRRHWWLVTSAAMALMFYQLGILLRRLGWLNAIESRLSLCMLAAVLLTVSLLTFNRNHALNDHSVPVVLMIGAYYGNIWWFLLSSLAGIAAMLYISQIFAANRVLTYLGQITLTLMCLDGILLDFVNPGAAALLMRLHPEQNVWFFTALCLVCTVLSLLVCIPANWLLERYLPFVIGRAGRPRAPFPAATATAADRAQSA